MLGEIPNRRRSYENDLDLPALINSIFAAFLIALDLSYHGFLQGTPWWSLLKLSTSGMIILVGMCVWLSEMGILSLNPVLLGSVFLIALGPSTIVWAVHVALTTGTIELHMAVYGVSLMVQGLASLMGAAEARSAVAS